MIVLYNTEISIENVKKTLHRSLTPLIYNNYKSTHCLLSLSKRLSKLIAIPIPPLQNDFQISHLQFLGCRKQ